MFDLGRCECESPVIKCDHRGCRCQMCGNLERLELPKPRKLDAIEEYEAFTETTGLYPEANTGSLIAINYVCLGLGEAGECQGKLKKVWRGDLPLEEQLPAMIDEAGDVLWYLTRLSIELGVGLTGLMDRNMAKLRDRKARGVIRGSGDKR